MATTEELQASTLRGWQAVELIYHSYLTGLILSAALHRGKDDAAEMVFRLFRYQHEQKFLPGLEKLGLRGLPDAVACAQYHYFSNSLGGVKVQYMYESDRKAWVRYLPPRWIYPGSTICGVPPQVSRAMLRAWHAHNGVTLGNARLGYVCTKQTVDGQPGLEGYFMEYDHDLAPEERLRFAPDEAGPDFDPAQAPALESASWPKERTRKAMRNYSMDYIRTLLPVLVELFGAADGGWLGAHTGKLVGMQLYDELAELVGTTDNGNAATAQSFADFLVRMGLAQGDEIEQRRDGSHLLVRQHSWRLMRGVTGPEPAVFDAWNGLWEGTLAVHNPHLRLEVTQRLDAGGSCNEWHIVE